MRVVQYPEYFFQNCVHLTQYIVISKTNHAIPLGFEESSSYRITCRLIRVLTTVELYNQTTVRTAKVNDVGTYWVLTSEFGPRELSIAQAHPELGFDISLLTAQLTRSVAQLLRDCHALTLALSR